jgi:hypothetical protein
MAHQPRSGWQFLDQELYTGVDSYGDHPIPSTSTQEYHGFEPSVYQPNVLDTSSMQHLYDFNPPADTHPHPFDAYSHPQPTASYFLPPAAPVTATTSIDPTLVTRQQSSPYFNLYSRPTSQESNTQQQFHYQQHSLPQPAPVDIHHNHQIIAAHHHSSSTPEATSAKGKEKAVVSSSSKELSQEQLAWQRAWPTVKAELEPSHMSRAPLSTARKLVKLLSTFTEPSEQRSGVPVLGRKDVLMAIRQRGNDDFCSAWVAESSGRELLEVWLKEAVGSGKGTDGVEYRDSLDLVLKVGSHCHGFSFLQRRRSFSKWIENASLDARTIDEIVVADPRFFFALFFFCSFRCLTRCRSKLIISGAAKWANSSSRSTAAVTMKVRLGFLLCVDFKAYINVDILIVFTDQVALANTLQKKWRSLAQAQQTKETKTQAQPTKRRESSEGIEG